MINFEDDVKDAFLKALMKNMSDGMVEDVKKARTALTPEALDHASKESAPTADEMKLKDQNSPGVHNQDGDGADEFSNMLDQEDESEDDMLKKVRKFRPNNF